MKSIQHAHYLSMFPAPQSEWKMNNLPEIRKQLKKCLESKPQGYMLIETFQKENDRTKSTVQARLPLEHILFLANNETSFRANEEKGLNPERHEPIESIRAMETVLSKGIPSVIRRNPANILESAALTYSENIFSRLLACGLLRPEDTQKTMTMLSTLWRKCLQKASYDKNATIRSQNNGNPEDLPSSSRNLPASQSIWPLDGILAYNERILFNLTCMGLSVLKYKKVYQFIAQLRERLAETRHQKFLTKWEAEANQPKKLSKSAKRKARVKAARAQALEHQPPAGREASSSGLDQLTAVPLETFDRTSRPPSPSRGLSNSPKRQETEAPVPEAVSEAAPETGPEVRPVDPAVRELRERVARLLPTPQDRKQLRERVEKMKMRIERLETNIARIHQSFSTQQSFSKSV